VKAKPKPKVKAEAKPKVKAKPKPKVKAEAKPKVKAKSKPKVKVEVEPKPKIKKKEKPPEKIKEIPESELPVKAEPKVIKIEEKPKPLEKPPAIKEKPTIKPSPKPRKIKKKTKTEKKESKPAPEIVESSIEEEDKTSANGVIRKGSIAEFMRKRTQLVGFDIGFNKHSQYSAEFLDNSLDGIESYNWKSEKGYKIKKVLEPEQVEKLQNDFKNVTENTDGSEYDIARKPILNTFNSFIEPIKDIIDREPLAIIRIREIEKPKMLPEEMHGKDIRMFSFEVFDNGTGMVPSDLEKFGLYLASSKSANLKQTRGSQGFGASSAFSDSQNTTGRPIMVITRHESASEGTLSAFYTTSKNEKDYALGPETFRTKMQHGTYVNLNYLNVRYTRGYADEYIRQASFLNGHITLIFIDPYGEVSVYPRRVPEFPNEPKYAQPHPASVLIGEFQDLLRSTNKQDIASFLSTAFVRMSKNKAKEIVEKSNQMLGAAQNILSLAPNELSDTSIRALYRNLTRSVVCIKKDSPEQLLKNVQKHENKPIIKIFSQFYDYNKDQFETVLKQLRLLTKKSDDITIDEIKNIQENYRESSYCPFAISFAKFKAYLKENPNTIEDILSSDFCNLNLYTIKKLILKSEEILKIRNLYALDSEELKKKEIKVLYDSMSKNVSDLELTLDQFQKFLKESEGKSIVTTLKKIKGIGKKSLEIILEECNDQLEYKSLANTPAKDLTQKVIHTIYVQMNDLEKCPSSITVNKFTEMINETNNKTLSSFLSQNFIGLNKKEIDDLLNETNESLGGTESLELIKPSDLNEDQMNTLFKVFSSENYLAPPTDTVVPVSSENLLRVIDDAFQPAFVEAETRKPTSGKGLAFGVEVAIAYGGQIKDASRATDVLYRFVNRTPKLRDNSDCAIWKAVGLVNWKNYKLDAYDNGLPKGKVRVIVNVSGPFVHVMFKSQSKQALADDETLKREIQLGLEEVGRKLRSYLLKKEKKKKRARRASLLLNHVKAFAESLNNILLSDDGLAKQVSVPEIEKLMIAPIEKDIKEDILTILPTNWTPLDEIVEDLGLSNLREKWILNDLIIPILKNLENQNVILKETREEVVEEEIYEEDGIEKKRVKKKKIDYYKLISEYEPEKKV
ncbi:MAG: ATP-binding protein, partial [Candidatus Hodarchaeota archaeon]